MYCSKWFHLTQSRITRIVFSLLILLLVYPTVPSNAQTDKPFSAGNRVLITAKSLDVHVKPSADSTLIGQFLVDQGSTFLQAQKDAQGNGWIYLAAVYGWVQSEVTDKSKVVPVSDTILAQEIERANADIKADAKNVDAYRRLGDLYIFENKLQDSLSTYSQGLTIDPKNGLLYRRRGSIENGTGNFQQATSDFGQALALSGKSVAIFDLLAVGNINQQQFDQAINYINQAIALAPDYGILYSRLAGIYRRQRQYTQALQDGTHAVQFDPLLYPGYRERAKTYYAMANYESFLQDINKAIEINPLCADCFVDRGIYYTNIQRDNQAAFTSFDQAVKADPHNANALMNRGIAYGDLGDAASGLKDLEQAMQLTPRDENIIYNLATLQTRNGDYDAAIKSYATLISGGGHYTGPSHLYRAQVYNAVGSYDLAIGDINDWLAHIGSDMRSDFIALAYLTRATAYLYKGDYLPAGESYDKASGADAAFLLNYSNSTGYGMDVKREALIAGLQQKLTSNSTDAATQLQLANMDMEFGHWQDGLDAYRSYLKLQGNPALETLVTHLTDILK